jgi:hypothetical protein
MAGRNSVLVLAAAILFFALPAKADLTISSKPTQNVSCSAGVCTATDKKAVLNVGELTAMLGAGDVTVSTGGVAKDIEVSAGLSWASTSRLTLEADKSLIVKQPVTVAGSGALTLSSNGGHQNVDLEFFGKGSVQFWDLSSSLVINGKSYTLVGDIATLAADIAANPAGFYALAKSYDASADGTYSSSPIPTTFGGAFEGLGNEISNLRISFSSDSRGVLIGLLMEVDHTGIVRNIGVADADLEGVNPGVYGAVAPLVGLNAGFVDRSWSSATLGIPGGEGAQPGGLVGDNQGTVSNSFAIVKLDIASILSNIGGLVGANEGIVYSSYSTGEIVTGLNNNAGGLVGVNSGAIDNAFATTSIHQKRRCCGGGNYGGIVGKNDAAGQIADSYAAASINAKATDVFLGGLVGFDGAQSGGIIASYWDLDLSISDPSQGAGNLANDPGITGLTTGKLQSGLPAGFDPRIWGQRVNINDGFPYLFSIVGK